MKEFLIYFIARYVNSTTNKPIRQVYLDCSLEQYVI